MDSPDKRHLQILSRVHKGLLITLIILCLVFIGGTIYGFFFHTVSSKNSQIDITGKNTEGQIFTGIGRIRVPTRDTQPGMVIIFVSFFYFPEDKPFAEELALRIGDFRDIISEYIASFPIAELQQTSEESIKAELLNRLNAILRLGKLERLYFNDFMIIG